MSKQTDLINIPDAITVSGSNVGIGETVPLGKLHVKTADSGATVDVGADELVIEGSGNAGMSILSGASNTGSIYFGDSGTNWDGYIAYSQNSRSMTFGTAAGGGSMTLDSSGSVTMPNQPAFSVRPAGAQNNIAVNAQVQIIWGTETFDVGGNFASNVFTAPVSGKYQFNVVVGVENLDSAAIYAETVLITSNTSIYTTIDPDFGQDTAFWSFTTPVLCDMDAGDTAYVAIVQGGGAAQMDVRIYSHFNGYLVA